LQDELSIAIALRSFYHSLFYESPIKVKHWTKIILDVIAYSKSYSILEYAFYYIDGIIKEKPVDATIKELL